MAAAEALDRCPWLCGAPLGPGTPFAWPVYFVVDSLRILIVVACAVVYLTGVILGLWGYYQHLFREHPARDRTTRQDPSP